MSPKSVLCARVYATVGPTATKSSSESTDRLALDIIRSGTVGELQKCFFIIPSSSFQLSRNRESWFQARCVAQAGSEKLSDAYEFLGGTAPPDIFAVCRQGGACVPAFASHRKRTRGPLSASAKDLGPDASGRKRTQKDPRATLRSGKGPAGPFPFRQRTRVRTQADLGPDTIRTRARKGCGPGPLAAAKKDPRVLSRNRKGPAGPFPGRKTAWVAVHAN
jgi:hypothetical protein